MTSQSPRIYTYKITFEEVLYYYYGVHKEKKFGEYYVGSPKTHKWCWELYTPKKQTLQLFDYTDEGWKHAQKIEGQLIKPFYNVDKWCLNESCSGNFSLDTRRKNGKNLYKNKNACFSLTQEERSELSKKIGQKSYEDGKGIHSLTIEEKREIGKKCYEDGIGVHSLTFEERSINSKKANSHRWMCTETGFITNAGNLAKYQRARGIDTSKRVRIS